MRALMASEGERSSALRKSGRPCGSAPIVARVGDASSPFVSGEAGGSAARDLRGDAGGEEGRLREPRGGGVGGRGGEEADDGGESMCEAKT